MEHTGSAFAQTTIPTNMHTANHCNVPYEQNFRHNIINIHTLIRKLLHTMIPGTIMRFIVNYIKGRNVYTTYIHHTTSILNWRSTMLRPLTHIILHLNGY